jgi:uncharacterized spore protein YtfJ
MGGYLRHGPAERPFRFLVPLLSVGAMADAFSSLVEAFRNMGVARAYGAPVQIGGEELVPVALVSFGFGGGGDSGAGGGDGVTAGASGAAEGGGGGGFVLPLGAYTKNGEGKVVFRANTLTVLLGLVPVVCAVGMSLRGVVKAVSASRR